MKEQCIISIKIVLLLSLLNLAAGCKTSELSVNSPPDLVLSVPSTTAEEGRSYAYNVNCTDRDGDSLSLTLGERDSCGGTLQASGGSGIYVLVIGEHQGGTVCEVAVACSDRHASVQARAGIEVREVNAGPVIGNLPGLESAHWGQAGRFEARATDSDLPANTLHWSLAGHDCPFTPTVAPATGEVRWTCDQAVSCTVNITVSDDGIPSLNDTRALAILCANERPRITSTAPLTAEEGVAYVYEVGCSDADGDQLTLVPGAGDTCGGNLADGGGGAGQYVFTPPSGASPDYCRLQVGCTDTQATVLETAAVTIKKQVQDSDPYWLEAPHALTVHVNQSYERPNGRAADDDRVNANPGDPGYLTCGLASQTCTFAVNVSGSGSGEVSCRLNFTAGTREEACTAELRVSDGTGRRLTRVVSLQVRSRPAKVVHVDSRASGDETGLTWAHAFTNLQAGVNAASAGEWVFVALGTYRATASAPVLLMKAGVSIFGGFSGDESTLAGRGDPRQFPTILDGEERDASVVTGASDALLDGFTIMRGKIDGYGGGMHNHGVSPTVSNCIFSGNTATRDGGGMYNAANSSPVVINCSFLDNRATDDGGGVYNEDGTPLYRDCLFSGNRADDKGGGMFNLSASPSVAGCTFEGNTTSGKGGGMYNEENASPLIIQSHFRGNRADDGGGMYNHYGAPTVTNCSFVNNHADDDSGGMFNYRSSPRVTGCIFQGNSADADSGGMHNYNASPTVTNCLFSGNYADDDGGGMYNDHSSPIVVNCTFSGNSAGDQGDGLYNRADSSPLIKNSILWDERASNELVNSGSTPVVIFSDIQGGFAGQGNIDLPPAFADAAQGDFRLLASSPCKDAGTADGAPATDLEGNHRPSCNGYDMGAYELPCRP